MGCASGKAVGFSWPTGQTGSDFVALLISGQGVFAMRVDGSSEKIHGQSWAMAACALPTSDGKDVLVCHYDAIYKMGLSGAPYSILNKGRWSETRALIRPATEGNVLYIVCKKGFIKMNLTDGSYKELPSYKEGNAGWIRTTAAVYDPSEPDIAYIFHTEGLLKKQLSDESHDATAKRIGDRTWDQAKAAVFDKERGAAMVFHSEGIFRVKLSDGSAEMLSTKNWRALRGAVAVPDGKVLAFDPDGTYLVDMSNGSATKANQSTWGHVQAVCPLDPAVCASSWSPPAAQSDFEAQSDSDPTRFQMGRGGVAT